MSFHELTRARPRVSQAATLVSGIYTPTDATKLFSRGYLEFRPRASSTNDRTVEREFSNASPSRSATAWAPCLLAVVYKAAHIDVSDRTRARMSFMM